MYLGTRTPYRSPLRIEPRSHRTCATRTCTASPALGMLPHGTYLGNLKPSYSVIDQAEERTTAEMRMGKHVEVLKFISRSWWLAADGGGPPYLGMNVSMEWRGSMCRCSVEDSMAALVTSAEEAPVNPTLSPCQSACHCTWNSPEFPGKSQWTDGPHRCLLKSLMTPALTKHFARSPRTGGQMWMKSKTCVADSQRGSHSDAVLLGNVPHGALTTAVQGPTMSRN
jgi:hypothetical protein